MSDRSIDLLMDARRCFRRHYGPFAFVFQGKANRWYGYWPRTMIPFL